MSVASKTTKWLDRLGRIARELPGIVRFRVGIWARRIRNSGPVVLVYRHAALGDVICTFPAVRALREKYPGCYIVYATNRQYVPIVRMSGCADQIVECEEPLLRIHRIVDRDFSVALRPTYADERGDPGSPLRLVDELSAALGVAPTDRQPHVSVPDELSDWANERVASLGTTGPIIAFHAGPTWGVKVWPRAAWDELSSLCRTRLGATVVQFGDTRVIPELGLQDMRIRGAADWVGQLSIAQTTACLAKCDLLVGIDSGLIHVAGAVGTPCVGVFGPTSGKRLMPPATPSDFVQAEVACSGCHHRRPVAHRFISCDYNVACMAGISAEAVFERVARLLGRRDEGRQNARELPENVCSVES
jgi:ADP-heptose:LPS heptosyltransferase